MAQVSSTPATRTRTRRVRRGAPKMTREQACEAALVNALSNRSEANYETIFEEFMSRGIPEEEIIPRENVFTYNAWLQLGRQVRKGERGVKITSMVPKTIRDTEGNYVPDIGENGAQRMRAVGASVFHISQTDPVEKK